MVKIFIASVNVFFEKNIFFETEKTYTGSSFVKEVFRCLTSCSGLHATFG